MFKSVTEFSRLLRLYPTENLFRYLNHRSLAKRLSVARYSNHSAVEEPFGQHIRENKSVSFENCSAIENFTG